MAKDTKKEIENNRFEEFFLKHSRKIENIKKIFAIIGVIVVALALLEFSSFLGIQIYRKLTNVISRSINEDIDVQEPWYKDYFEEMDNAIIAEYEPYTGFKMRPNFSGNYINIDERGVRKTENPCVGEEPLKVFMFGGSAMWGVGARDENTIPSLVSRIMCKKGYNVEVTNYGIPGYTQTQEMLKLIALLQRGEIPDIVIFYDGHNAVWASYVNGIVGYSEDYIKRKLEYNSTTKASLAGLFTNFYSAYRYLTNRSKVENWVYENSESYNHKIANVYLNNIKIVESLGDSFGFKLFPFWQPNIFTKENLSESEKTNVFLDEDIAESYRGVTGLIELSDDVVDLSSVFDDENDTIYIDSAHTTEEGNFTVALKIVEKLEEYLNGTK